MCGSTISTDVFFGVLGTTGLAEQQYHAIYWTASCAATARNQRAEGPSWHKLVSLCLRNTRAPTVVPRISETLYIYTRGVNQYWYRYWSWSDRELTDLQNFQLLQRLIFAARLPTLILFHCCNVNKLRTEINPYPANVDNMASSYQC